MMINEYIKLDDLISESNKSLKEHRLAKKNLEETIKSFMEEQNLSKLEVNNEVFIMKETTKEKSMTKKTIINGLLDILNHEEVDKITNNLFNDDGKTVLKSIQRKKK